MRTRGGRGRGAVPAVDPPGRRQGARRAARRPRMKEGEGEYERRRARTRQRRSRARPRSSSSARSSARCWVGGRVPGGGAVRAQEAEFAARLLEVSGEQELEQILGGIVNTVGHAVQGAGARRLAAGRALVEAPRAARAALPFAVPVRRPRGRSLRDEISGMNQEHEGVRGAPARPAGLVRRAGCRRGASGRAG